MLNLIQPGLATLPQRAGWSTRALELDQPPAVAAPSGPPSGAMSGLAELAGLGAVLRLPGAGARLRRLPTGDGHLVLDIPGWRAPEATGAPLRRFLRATGHDAQAWGLGTNTGRPEHDAERLGEIVAAAAARRGPVSLVGWSLGGVIAREVARARPEDVRRVVTYGTPVVGGPTHTVGAQSFGVAECERITALAEQLDRDDPIIVPITAIYTRRDRVVAWQACLDRRSPHVEHVEVRSTHLGLGLDPDVWEVAARRLARAARR